MADASLWLLAAVFVGGAMALAVGGYFATRRMVKIPLMEGHNDIAGFLFATVGVLYSVLLAFIVFAVWQQFSAADDAVTSEAAMLVTVFRDTQRFPQPYQQQAQDGLRSYANEVITSEWASHGTLRPHTTPDPLNVVWQAYWGLPSTVQAAPWYPGALDRLHDLEDRRHMRHLSGEATLPPVFWAILVIGAFVTVGFTYFFHLENRLAQAIMTAILAGGIGAILFLLVALDRPFTGQVQVSQQPFQHALLQFTALNLGMGEVATTGQPVAPAGGAVRAASPTARTAAAAARTATATAAPATNSATAVASRGSASRQDWSTVASMPTARTGLAAVTAPDGRIYALGGYHETYLATVEAYNPRSGAWATVASLPAARTGLAAAAGRDGRIYALGGTGGNDAVLGTVEVFNPTSNTWSSVASLPTARTGLAAVVGGDGRLYALGGFHDSALSTVEVYDPASNTWNVAASLPTARTGLAAVTGPDGRIYAIGGFGGDGLPVAAVEVFDPRTNRWAAGASLPSPRGGLAAVLGPDGRLYAIGGNATCEHVLDLVSAYTPDAASWSVVANLATARTEPAAAVGRDGRIYTIGGAGNCQGENLASVEALGPIQK